MRYFAAMRRPDGGAVTKRDLAGSDKGFPFVLPGVPTVVAVVEGGVNALALQDLADLSGVELPTVIATGGVSVRRWLRENLRLRKMVGEASEITIWSENERDADGCPDLRKQVETDRARNLLQSEIAELVGAILVQRRAPPAEHKDVADWLLSLRKGITSGQAASRKSAVTKDVGG